jgi:hypothetical protein
MSVRVDTQIMPDGTVYLVSPQRPNLRKRVPKEQSIEVSDLEHAIGVFRAECEACFVNGEATMTGTRLHPRARPQQAGAPLLNRKTTRHTAP